MLERVPLSPSNQKSNECAWLASCLQALHVQLKLYTLLCGFVFLSYPSLAILLSFQINRWFAMSAMSAMGTNRPKKRGRPAKYASTDEKKAANAERRRTQRENKAAVAQEVQFQQHCSTGPGQAAFFWPPSTQLVWGGPSTLGRVLGAAQNC